MSKGRTESAEAAPGSGPRFEDGLAELETIVRTLEQGALPLEDSLAAFERGMALVQGLSRILDEVEQRVEVLLRQADGSVLRRPLEEDDE